MTHGNRDYGRSGSTRTESRIAPPPYPKSATDVATFAAASHVRATPRLVAEKAEARTGLTATGLAALHRLEAEIAWAER
jgi:hypothetical protein